MRLIVTITCEQCLAVYRKPLAELCQRGMRNLHLEVRHQSLSKNENLFQEGETPRNVYILQTGLLKLFRDVEPGHQATVRLVHPGELFGYTSLLSDETYSLSAESLAPSELCVFSAAAFFKAMESDATFTRSLLQRTAKELRATRLDLLLRAEHDATSKIASHLIELAGHPDPLVPNGHGIRITRTALGDLSGSAQETVSRVLGKLEGAGLIQRKGRSIHVTDREGLRHLAAQRRTTGGNGNEASVTA
jgi:CRP/FNR family transcriptional regulator